MNVPFIPWKRLNRQVRLTLLILVLLFIGVLIFILWWQETAYDQAGLPTRYISYQFVSSRAESHLYYPNSNVFSLFGQPERITLGSSSVAFSGAILTTNDQPAIIDQWYSVWLLAHGWQRNDNAIHGLADTQTSMESYSRGSRELFYVAMDDPSTLGKSRGKKIPIDSTVFEIRYIIKPN